MTHKLLLGLSLAFTLSLGLASCVDELDDCAKNLCGDASGGMAGAAGAAGAPSGGASGGGGANSGGGSSGGATGGTGGTGGTVSACKTACSGAKPECDEDTGECVECLDGEQCTSNEVEKLCDTSSKTCVECVGATDCGDAGAARCEGGACVGCEEPADCTRLTDTPACKVETGACVECTSDEDCDGTPCNLLTNKCSAYGKDRRPCESCDTDANCEDADHYCVPMAFNAVDRVGGYCLEDVDAGCDQPFGVGVSGRNTLSGVTGKAFCGINEVNATCEAVRALLDNQQCPGGADGECPESGLCRTVGVLGNRCTYACAAAQDCPGSGAGSTCDGAPNGYCGD